MQLHWKHSNQLKNSGDSWHVVTQDRLLAFMCIVKLQLLPEDILITSHACIFKFFLNVVDVNLTLACMVCKSCGLDILVNKSCKL